jgi:hypothetical protein
VPAAVLIVAAASLLAVTAWSRGVGLAGRAHGWVLKGLPRWLRHPATVGGLGLLLPGSGLLIAGYPRRAAAACWMAGAALAGWIFVGRGVELWAALAGAPDAVRYTFEVSLIGSVLFIGLGGFVWIGQSLEGVRLSLESRGRAGGQRGDRIALVLLLSIVALVALFDAAGVAQDLDLLALSLRAEGLELAPLCLMRVSTRLDPSQPAYVLHLADQLDSLERHDRAQALRRDLDRRWRSYRTSSPFSVHRPPLLRKPGVPAPSDAHP